MSCKAIALSILLVLQPVMVAADCINYGDYLHWVGCVDTPDHATGVVISGSHAYVADRSGGLQVTDISNPERPFMVGSVSGYPDWAGVAISCTHAYVSGNDLQVIDITIPESPQVTGSVETPGYAQGVAVSGDCVLVADGDLQILPLQCEITDVSDHLGELHPATVALASYPNPFTPTTTIAFDVPVAGTVCVDIYDLRGRLIATLLEKVIPAGHHEVVWTGRDSNGQDVPSGVYFSHLEAGGLVTRGRMTLVR
jgi:hypothetical protein